VLTLLLAGMAVLLPNVTLHAQSFSARSYGQDDGLDNLAIVQLAQDPAGHLWIATENGLFRYDGARFTEFGRAADLNDSRNYNLHVDHLGTVWAATRTALCYFDGERFREVQLRGHAILVGANSKLASNSRGELVVSTISVGLLSIEKDTATAEWTALPYAERHPAFQAYGAAYGAVQGVTFDGSDRLWFGCGKTICAFSPDGSDEMRPQDILKLDTVPAGEYDSLLVQQNARKNGRLWARSRKFILTWLPGETKPMQVSARLPARRTLCFATWRKIGLATCLPRPRQALPRGTAIAGRKRQGPPWAPSKAQPLCWQTTKAACGLALPAKVCCRRSATRTGPTTRWHRGLARSSSSA